MQSKSRIIKIGQGSSLLWTKVKMLRCLKLTGRRNDRISIKMRRVTIHELGLKRIWCKQFVEFTVNLAFCWIMTNSCNCNYVSEPYSMEQMALIKPWLNYLDNAFDILKGLECFNYFFSVAKSPYMCCSIACMKGRNGFQYRN